MPNPGDPEVHHRMIGKAARDAKAGQYWQWHIMHPFNHRVHDSRRM
jgi:hypothetical protein